MAPLGVGNYRLDVLATDTFNLTHERFVTFSGKCGHSIMISQLLGVASPESLLKFG